jgi:hypothetical protein
MAGAVAIVIILLLAPIGICMSMAAVAAVLGETLARDGEIRNADSELLDLNV